jgi:4a-hydroxytetrahydrobiopterin dehydratase
MQAKKLSDAEVLQALQALPHWKQTGQVITRQHQCASYPQACALLVQVAFLAEQHNHHPDIEWKYREVTIHFTTHDVGGLSNVDMLLAQKIDALLG